MTGQPMMCSRCGYANTPGDHFCGSCGAFLEWEGTPPEPGAPPAQVAGATAGPATAPPGASVGAAPLPAASPTVDHAAEGLLRCPACGIANAASRTFCQTCGAKLTPAARISSRSRDEIAAAVVSAPVAAPPPAVPRTSPGALTPPGAGTSVTAPQAKGSGLPGWVFAVIALGVLVGVAAVVGSQLLKGSGPASIASEAPTPSGPAAAASGSAGSSAAPASAAASGQAAGPTPTPLTPKPLKLTGASASSVAGGNTAKYGPQLAIDGSLKTSWQEGSTVEKGEWIEVSFDPSTVTAVVIRNGFQASTALYKGNLRLKDVLVAVDGGTPKAVRLADTQNAQAIDLGQVAGATTVRITIVTTYPSVKTAVSGTPFNDAAVSEIGVLGIKGG